MEFYHRGAIGDIIYSLPTILAYGDTEAILYFKRGHFINTLSRLLKSQSYIKDVKHRKTGIGKDYIDLSAYYGIAWEKRDQHLVVSHLEPHDKTYDLSQAWLRGIEPNHVADIIVNRTKKYHGQLDWHLLKPYADRCKFVGTEWEMDRFNRYGLGIDYHRTEDALDVAQVIKGSKLFIGNQSMCFAITEAMKHPRCLEVCPSFNNCQPHGDNGYTSLTEELLETCLEDR